ncbi:hypothetical protein EGH21_22435 [Halomicroarcula sp. F13]|uniref:SWIM-type domain-containing protein n=1 Tax=Haloarcula rubra TaxID=2487747 RepID=A0AAW4PYR1_9EURY|nr:hypothetical protein [Halomicroarcula rubra]MBX0325779.1 hypothetical protein [Halomicroarcula rubra]
MADEVQRVIGAFEDVVAIEHDEDAGLFQVVTWCDTYLAIPTEGQHLCPDVEYHLEGNDRCKHQWAVDIVRGRVDAPAPWLVVDDLDQRSEDGDRFPDFDEFEAGEVSADV